MKHCIVLLFLISAVSCKKDNPPQPKDLSLFYIIVDKSSNSFSANGGKEENYIDLDTLYFHRFIDTLYYQVNHQKNKSDIILFFNYVDKDTKGNKELYFKIPAFEAIDTTYKSRPDKVLSSRKSFKKNILDSLNNREKELKRYASQKETLLKDLQTLLTKSHKASGSDCSGVLKTADTKLQNYLFNKETYYVKSRMIIAFSDLVNFPPNHQKIKLETILVRPGYSSEVPYLESQYLNITTKQEFLDVIFNTLSQ